MSSTPSNDARGSSANGAARRDEREEARRRRCGSIADDRRRSAGRGRRAGSAGRTSPRPRPPPSRASRPRAARRSPRYFGKIDAARDGADAVAGAADALQARRDRRRRLDLHDEIDGADVDAELEREVATMAGSSPRLRRSSMSRRRLARDRAVVGERDLLAGELVQRGGEALGEAAAVDEDHRRAVRADELDEARVDRRPDGAAASARGRGVARAAISSSGSPSAAMSLDGHLDPQLPAPSSLPASTMVDRGAAARRSPIAAAEEARDLVERALRRREADALERRRAARAERLEALEREEEVSAALGRDERVDLVDDHRLDRGERPRAPPT